jgi:hypothetical protein
LSLLFVLSSTTKAPHLDLFYFPYI